MGQFAIVSNVTIKDGRDDEAVGMLHSMVVPESTGLAGHVTSFWTKNGSKGIGMQVFDSKEAAEAALAKLVGTGEGPPPEAPITLDSFEIYEVLASL